MRQLYSICENIYTNGTTLQVSKLEQGSSKVIIITFGSEPPPLKVIIRFLATRPIFEILKCILFL